MKIKLSGVLCALVFSASLFSSAIAQKMTVEDVISKHLDSLGSAEQRGQTSTLVSTGEVEVVYITQKNQPAKGRIVMASEGAKIFFGLQLNASDYPQELMIFDGDKASVNFVRPGVRSDLGSFVYTNGELLKQGLLGGTLSTSWPLLNVAKADAKIKLSGTKKIDGREVYALDYQPKGGNDLDITIFIDKETFRHVRTEYRRILSSGVGRTIDESARTSETRLKVTEDYSDFKEVQGRLFPQKYKFHYSFSGTNGTKEVEWNYTLLDFAVNQALDKNTFAINK